MRLVIVSNRLPLVLEMVDGAWRTQPGAGGLIAALTPILQRQSGVWIGWSGASDVDQTDELQRTLDEYQRDAGFELIPVAMTSQEVEGFYRGFSNEIIWPLFHDLQSFCNFVPDYWTTYLAVNDKFAEIVAQHAQPDDLLWVQDYHLMGLGRQLRRRGLRNRLAFFLHIPFPPPDIFEKLPWRVDVLEGLLKYDVLGFQTPRDRKNFADCVRDLLPDARQRRRHGGLEVRWGGQTTFVRHFPIGIDYQALAQGAALPSVATHAEEIRREMPGEQLVLGLDRLDYTKGIPYRLRAFGRALERFEDLHRKVTLLQVVVPSRETVPEYQELRAEIERLVTQINGGFTQPGWVPIHYVFRSLEREELLAYYCAADVALVTPLKDGMNLVAKEYCACQLDGDGVLILSEFAGAAVQLRRDALLVNPYDLDGVAEALRRAVGMSRRQRQPAMCRMQRILSRQDVHWWANQVLQACEMVKRPSGVPIEMDIASQEHPS
ncbi:MAG TPA: trehalose-6-phosphate synthase [Phycisphaerae bacterium]|jgi:alpha,alpha-trehalose-phosphate synthase [UDP-forming]|nr:trehalose-6-phosphate synthase [Phycisphaerae bacterium]HRS27797.1 trehalose-6-phosphate synthase [Phycisphaerae bacterium]